MCTTQLHRCRVRCVSLELLCVDAIADGCALSLSLCCPFTLSLTALLLASPTAFPLPFLDHSTAADDPVLSGTGGDLSLNFTMLPQRLAALGCSQGPHATLPLPCVSTPRGHMRHCLCLAFLLRFASDAAFCLVFPLRFAMRHCVCLVFPLCFVSKTAPLPCGCPSDTPATWWASGTSATAPGSSHRWPGKTPRECWYRRPSTSAIPIAIAKVITAIAMRSSQHCPRLLRRCITAASCGLFFVQRVRNVHRVSGRGRGLLEARRRCQRRAWQPRFLEHDRARLFGDLRLLSRPQLQDLRPPRRNWRAAKDTASALHIFTASALRVFTVFALRVYTAFTLCVTTAVAAKIAHLPGASTAFVQRRCLCLVLPLPSRLRHRLCLACFHRPSSPRHRLSLPRQVSFGGGPWRPPLGVRSPPL